MRFFVKTRRTSRIVFLPLKARMLFLPFYFFTFLPLKAPFYRMVIVGTKCEESALVEMLFSCCCRWFFPMTRPAVHELDRKVTTPPDRKSVV